jgi:hypothetical protein
MSKMGELHAMLQDTKHLTDTDLVNVLLYRIGALHDASKKDPAVRAAVTGLTKALQQRFVTETNRIINR